MENKLKYAFLIPIGDNISGKLIPQLLSCYKYINSIGGKLYTISNRIHVDARNALATKGGGFVNPTKLIKNTEFLIWLDADQVYTVDMLKKLVEYDQNNKFISGWYIKDSAGRRSPQAMVARWDEEHFKKNGSMEFLHEDELLKAKKPIVVDYVGFGFCRIHSSVFAAMEYPYFRHNVTKIGNYQDNSSEDVSFCRNAAEACGIKPTVIPELRIGHLKEIIL